MTSRDIGEEPSCLHCLIFIEKTRRDQFSLILFFFSSLRTPPDPAPDAYGVGDYRPRVHSGGGFGRQSALVREGSRSVACLAARPLSRSPFLVRESCAERPSSVPCCRSPPRCGFAGLGGRVVGRRRRVPRGSGRGGEGGRVGDASRSVARAVRERDAAEPRIPERGRCDQREHSCTREQWRGRPDAPRARRVHGADDTAAPRIRVVCCLRCTRGSTVGVTTAQRAAHRRTSSASRVVSRHEAHQR